MSALQFAVTDASPKVNAAFPAVAFRLRISASEAVEALVLRVQVIIEPHWRAYDGKEKTLLQDLFGTPERWGTTLHALNWADLPLAVTAFDEQTEAELTVPCGFDFDAAAPRFLSALDGGEVSLRFLFSGAVFHADRRGWSSERVPWSSECAYRMGVQVWRDALRACYGDDVLLRVNRQTFEQLQAFRALSGASSWDDFFARLTQVKA